MNDSSEATRPSGVHAGNRVGMVVAPLPVAAFLFVTQTKTSLGQEPMEKLVYALTFDCF